MQSLPEDRETCFLFGIFWGSFEIWCRFHFKFVRKVKAVLITRWKLGHLWKLGYWTKVIADSKGVAELNVLMTTQRKVIHHSNTDQNLVDTWCCFWLSCWVWKSPATQECRQRLLVRFLAAQTRIITQKLYSSQHCSANDSGIFLASSYILN